MEGRGEEEVVEGMREKKMEGGKAEKSEWSERMTEKGRECSSFQAFLRGTSLRHFLLKEFLLNSASCAVANGHQSH